MSRGVSEIRQVLLIDLQAPSFPGGTVIVINQGSIVEARGWATNASAKPVFFLVVPPSDRGYTRRLLRGRHPLWGVGV